MLLNLLLCALALIVYFAVVMALSLRLRNHSLVDIFWGPGFVLPAVIRSHGLSGRAQHRSRSGPALHGSVEST